MDYITQPEVVIPAIIFIIAACLIIKLQMDNRRIDREAEQRRRERLDAESRFRANIPIKAEQARKAKATLAPIRSTQRTQAAADAISSQPASTANDGDFALSMLIAQATDSTAIGYAAGGSISGAILGDALSDSTPSISGCDSSSS